MVPHMLSTRPACRIHSFKPILMCKSALTFRNVQEEEEDGTSAVTANPAVSNSHVMKMLSAMLRSSYDVCPPTCRLMHAFPRTAYHAISGPVRGPLGACLLLGRPNEHLHGTRDATLPS